MSSILMAAAAGAAGWALGAGLVWGLSRALRSPPKWLTFIPVAFAMLGVALARSVEPSPGELAMAALDQSLTIQALRAHYPDDYAKLSSHVHAVARSATPQEAHGVVGDVLIDVMARQRGKANAESARSLYEVNRMEGRALRTADAAACAAFLDGRDASMALGKVLTPEIVKRDREASAGVLIQTATAPAPPAAAMTVDQLAKLSMEAVSTLPDADQDIAIDVLKTERAPATADEHRVMCDFSLALADTILSRPPAEAGELVRRIWAMR